jgi:Mn-dependent DtxR family transcriptional regulator
MLLPYLQHASRIMESNPWTGGFFMRSANGKRLEAIWQEVERQPGIRSGRVARQLGIARSSVARALPALEGQGLLLSEDTKGRLYPWGRRK